MDFFIDFETLGLLPICKIVQIGLIGFDKEKSIIEKCWNIDIENGLNTDRTVDESTLLFWIKNSSKITWSENTILLEKAINEIDSLFKTYVTEDSNLWSNGILFDISILGTLMKIPFKYSHILDYRTYRKMLNLKKDSTYDHNALNDCRSCVKNLIKASDSDQT